MFSLTSDCQREAFRFYPTAKLSVKHVQDHIAVSNISTNGLAFVYEKVTLGDIISISLQLADDLIIHATVKIIHKTSASKGSMCGAKFQQISSEDRELINRYILDQQKKQIRQRL